MGRGHARTKECIRRPKAVNYLVLVRPVDRRRLRKHTAGPGALAYDESTASSQSQAANDEERSIELQYEEMNS